uniref:K Homology domain-containing protein n=1 Tax=Quercus lobata TaxID=97700 RepID=A0A7N2M009_QUELO
MWMEDIVGGILAVKKALIDVSTSLQDKTPTPLNRPIGGASSGASPDEFFPNLSTLLPALPGTIVRAMQNEAGASIMFAAPLTESRERVVTISAWEVYIRLESGKTCNCKASSCIGLGCLGGNEGEVLSEMRGLTGADIRILDGDRIRNCASGNDVVVQITGEYRSVQDALFQVTCSLRDNLLPGEVRKAVRAKYPYMRLIVDPLRNDPVPNNIGALSPSRLLFPKFAPRALMLRVDINVDLGKMTNNSNLR